MSKKYLAEFLSTRYRQNINVLDNLELVGFKPELADYLLDLDMNFALDAVGMTDYQLDKFMLDAEITRGMIGISHRMINSKDFNAIHISYTETRDNKLNLLASIFNHACMYQAHWLADDEFKVAYYVPLNSANLTRIGELGTGYKIISPAKLQDVWKLPVKPRVSSCKRLSGDFSRHKPVLRVDDELPF